jgi:hypothetical protein
MLTEGTLFEGHEHVRSSSCGSQGSRSPTEPSSASPLVSAKPSSSNTAEMLEGAYDREARTVALDIPDREAILRVLEECPEELLELRSTLLQEHVWRQREEPV